MPEPVAPIDETVRAHALLGRLLDVEVHQRAALADPDRHPQPVARRARPPRCGGLEAVHVAEAEQVHEVAGAGDLAGRRLARRHRVQRGDPPGEGLGGGGVALVGQRTDRLLAHPQCQHRCERRVLVGGIPGVGHQLEPQPARVVELAPARGEVEQRDAVQAVGRHDVVAGRELPAVDDEQDVRRRRPLVGAEPGPVGQVGRQQPGQVAERGGHHPARPDGVGLARALGVGQPLEPVPVGQVALAREHGDDEVLGGVEGRGRADQRPGHRAGRLLVAADLDPVEGAQVDARGQPGLEPVHDEQPVQRGRRGGVDLVDRGALRRHELERERLGAHAVPHLEEVGVARSVLPDAGALLGDRGQRGRRRVVPGQRAALLVGGLAGDLADVGEVAQVLRARAGHLLGALLPLPVELHDDEAERREEEHARGEVAAPAGRAHRRHQHDRAEAAQHRDRVHEHAAGALVGLDLGRRLEHDLTGRQLRGLGSGTAQRRAHELTSPTCVWCLVSAARFPVRRQVGMLARCRPGSPSRSGVARGSPTLPGAGRHTRPRHQPRASRRTSRGGAMVPPGAATAAGTRPALALSVHGPAGVLDLVAPTGATARDLAREYAARAGLATEPVLHTRVGGALEPDAPLVAAGVGAGDLLVAVPPGAVRRAPLGLPADPVAAPVDRGPGTVVTCAVAAGLAVLAGVAGLVAGGGRRRRPCPGRGAPRRRRARRRAAARARAAWSGPWPHRPSESPRPWC